MIPLRDNNPTTSFPIITVLLIAINIYVFIANNQSTQAPYEMVPRDVTTEHQWVGYATIGRDGNVHFVPRADSGGESSAPSDQTIALPASPVSPWETIFTAMFLHANFLHIAGNMLFLWIFGNNVEDALGKVRYLLFYFGCGLAAALAQIAISPNSLIPTLGASGAIAGVLGAYIIMWPDARVKTLIFLGIFITIADISAFWVIGLWIALQIFEGVTGLGGMSTGGVAYGRSLGAKQRRIAGYSRR
jgi:membrane associated rhomboid family serine protease